MSFVAAATTPTAYITAFAAFQQGGGLGVGAKVFVPAGTGGVGLAVVHVAQSLGFEAW
ncbi:NADPH:quinone oxidoreductase [Micractinium conductrix]|uniref:NADPH:quinone oxidoreductase n=1 Tax=Micractinium conductrix TaxID=554055 RepID=A0A2P6VKT0_9CHLO|nr:NADPH:quinone oxidoreductase [Micractinium conductrix]|eukprot:PSC74711.1 NADPH:quinone oxidoreductase [Micractinium conductrix]